MPEFAELKAQGEALEAAGKAREALGLYRLAIREVEGTPAMQREVGLVTHVGQLLESLGDTAEACAAWEQAGRVHAETGSADGVIAACTAIHRADKFQTIIYPRLARALMDRQHVAAARTVLLKYAERAQARRATDVLTQLEGQDDATMRPAVERVLDAVTKGEETRLRRREEEQSELVVVHDTASEMPPEPTAVPPALEPEPELEPVSEPEPERVPGFQPEPEPPPPPPPPPPSRPSVPRPRLSQPVVLPTPGRNPTRLVIAGVAGGILLGAVLTQTGLIPTFFGGQPDGTPDAVVVDPPIMDPVSPIADTPFVARDTAELLPAPPPVPAPAPAPVLLVEDPIAVDGLVIAEVLPHQEDGELGYRVLQPLGNGDTLILYVIPLTDPNASAEPIVSPAGNGASGVVAFAGMRVRARAPIGMDSLDVLLRRLGGGGR